MRILRNLALGAAASLFIFSASFAQNTSKDAEFVFGNVMSPYCPGRLLQDCPTSEASKLKEEIRHSLQSGKTKDELIEDLVLRFGESMRAAPKKEGFGAVAWITPFVFLIIGALIVTFRTNATPSPESGADIQDPALEARIRRDLDKI